MQFGKSKAWWSFAAPEGVLLAATAVVFHVRVLHASLSQIAHFYPAAVCTLGALVAWRFQRGRLLFALILLMLATWSLEAPIAGVAARTTVAATALLLPLNLALVALLPDRGIFTRSGLTRLCVIGAQVLIVTLMRQPAFAGSTRLLTHAFLPTSFFAWTSLPQPALLASIVAVGATAIPLAFQPNAVGRGFVWSIAAAACGFGAHRPGPGPAAFMGTAGLILVVVALEASYVLAYHDGLTTLPSRRAFTEALGRLGGQYAVAMVDVDHFKRFNDQHGHDAGDQVLRMVAVKLSQVEGGGTTYRYGGEEFAIVFAGASVAETRPHLEAVRGVVAQSEFGIRRLLRRKKSAGRAGRGQRVRVSVTISIGVAERDGRHPLPEDVVAAADAALYRAKGAGRNRVCV